MEVVPGPTSSLEREFVYPRPRFFFFFKFLVRAWWFFYHRRTTKRLGRIDLYSESPHFHSYLHAILTTALSLDLKRPAMMSLREVGEGVEDV